MVLTNLRLSPGGFLLVLCENCGNFTNYFRTFLRILDHCGHTAYLLTLQPRRSDPPLKLCVVLHTLEKIIDINDVAVIDNHAKQSLDEKHSTHIYKF